MELEAIIVMSMINLSGLHLYFASNPGHLFPLATLSSLCLRLSSLLRKVAPHMEQSWKSGCRRDSPGGGVGERVSRGGYSSCGRSLR